MTEVAASKERLGNFVISDIFQNIPLHQELGPNFLQRSSADYKIHC